MDLYYRISQRVYVEAYIIVKKISFLWSRAKLSWLFFRSKFALSEKALNNYRDEYERELRLYGQKIQNMTDFGKNMFGEDKFDDLLDEQDNDKD